MLVAHFSDLHLCDENNFNDQIDILSELIEDAINPVGIAIIPIPINIIIDENILPPKVMG